MRLRDLRGSLARWVVDEQDVGFTARFAPGGDLVVPYTLCRDSVESPFCSYCSREMEDPRTVEGHAEAVLELLEITGLSGEPTPEHFRAEQLAKFGDFKDYAWKS